jgi:hypothetical protein
MLCDDMVGYQHFRGSCCLNLHGESMISIQEQMTGIAVCEIHLKMNISYETDVLSDMQN